MSFCVRFVTQPVCFTYLWLYAYSYPLSNQKRIWWCTDRTLIILWPWTHYNWGLFFIVNVIV